MDGKSFNFYQYYDSGAYFGSDFLSLFAYNLFTGFYTPSDIVIAVAPAGQPQVEIYSEWILFPQQFSINFQGVQNSANNDRPIYSLDFYGNFIPFLKESGNLSFQVVGIQSGINTDRPSFSTNISGDYGLSNREYFPLSCLVSGEYGITSREFPTLDLKFTGSFINVNRDNPSFEIKFSGYFSKIKKESIQFNMGINNFLWSSGTPLPQENIQKDSNTFNFNINTFRWSSN